MTEETYVEIYRRGDRDLGGRHLSFPGHVMADATTWDAFKNNRSWFECTLFERDRRTANGDKYVLSRAYKTLWLTDQCELVVSYHADMPAVKSHLAEQAVSDELWGEPQDVARLLLERLEQERFWPYRSGLVLEWNSVQP